MRPGDWLVLGLAATACAALLPLLWRGGVSAELNEAASVLLRYLPLLLLPIAVSAYLFLHALEGQLLAVSAALILSLVISMVFTGWLMQRLIGYQRAFELIIVKPCQILG